MEQILGMFKGRENISGEPSVNHFKAAGYESEPTRQLNLFLAVYRFIRDCYAKLQEFFSVLR